MSTGSGIDDTRPRGKVTNDQLSDDVTPPVVDWGRLYPSIPPVRLTTNTDATANGTLTTGALASERFRSRLDPKVTVASLNESLSPNSTLRRQMDAAAERRRLAERTRGPNETTHAKNQQTLADLHRRRIDLTNARIDRERIARLRNGPAERNGKNNDKSGRGADVINRESREARELVNKRIREATFKNLRSILKGAGPEKIAQLKSAVTAVPELAGEVAGLMVEALRGDSREKADNAAKAIPDLIRAHPQDSKDSPLTKAFAEHINANSESLVSTTDRSSKLATVLSGAPNLVQALSEKSVQDDGAGAGRVLDIVSKDDTEVAKGYAGFLAPLALQNNEAAQRRLVQLINETSESPTIVGIKDVLAPPEYSSLNTRLAEQVKPGLLPEVKAAAIETASVSSTVLDVSGGTAVLVGPDGGMEVLTGSSDAAVLDGSSGGDVLTESADSIVKTTTDGVEQLIQPQASTLTFVPETNPVIQDRVNSFVEVAANFDPATTPDTTQVTKAFQDMVEVEIHRNPNTSMSTIKDSLNNLLGPDAKTEITIQIDPATNKEVLTLVPKAPAVIPDAITPELSTTPILTTEPIVKLSQESVDQIRQSATKVEALNQNIQNVIQEKITIQVTEDQAATREAITSLVQTFAESKQQTFAQLRAFRPIILVMAKTFPPGLTSRAIASKIKDELSSAGVELNAFLGDSKSNDEMIGIIADTITGDSNGGLDFASPDQFAELSAGGQISPEEVERLASQVNASSPPQDIKRLLELLPQSSPEWQRLSQLLAEMRQANPELLFPDSILPKPDGGDPAPLVEPDANDGIDPVEPASQEISEVEKRLSDSSYIINNPEQAAADIELLRQSQISTFVMDGKTCVIEVEEYPESTHPTYSHALYARDDQGDLIVRANYRRDSATPEPVEQISNKQGAGWLGKRYAQGQAPESDVLPEDTEDNKLPENPDQALNAETTRSLREAVSKLVSGTAEERIAASEFLIQNGILQFESPNALLYIRESEGGAREICFEKLPAESNSEQVFFSYRVNQDSQAEILIPGDSPPVGSESINWAEEPLSLAVDEHNSISIPKISEISHPEPIIDQVVDQTVAPFGEQVVDKVVDTTLEAPVDQIAQNVTEPLFELFDAQDDWSALWFDGSQTRADAFKKLKEKLPPGTGIDLPGMGEMFISQDGLKLIFRPSGDGNTVSEPQTIFTVNAEGSEGEFDENSPAYSDGDFIFDTSILKEKGIIPTLKSVDPSYLTTVLPSVLPDELDRQQQDGSIIPTNEDLLFPDSILPKPDGGDPAPLVEPDANDGVEPASQEISEVEKRLSNSSYIIDNPEQAAVDIELLRQSQITTFVMDGKTCAIEIEEYPESTHPTYSHALYARDDQGDLILRANYRRDSATPEPVEQIVDKQDSGWLGKRYAQGQAPESDVLPQDTGDNKLPENPELPNQALNAETTRSLRDAVTKLVTGTAEERIAASEFLIQNGILQFESPNALLYIREGEGGAREICFEKLPAESNSKQVFFSYRINQDSQAEILIPGDSPPSDSESINWAEEPLSLAIDEHNSISIPKISEISQPEPVVDQTIAPVVDQVVESVVDKPLEVTIDPSVQNVVEPSVNIELNESLYALFDAHDDSDFLWLNGTQTRADAFKKLKEKLPPGKGVEMPGIGEMFVSQDGLKLMFRPSGDGTTVPEPQEIFTSNAEGTEGEFDQNSLAYSGGDFIFDSSNLKEKGIVPTLKSIESLPNIELSQVRPADMASSSVLSLEQFVQVSKEVLEKVNPYGSVISKGHLAELLESNDLPAEQEQAVAALYKNFDKLSDLTWTTLRTGISSDDLDKFLEIGKRYQLFSKDNAGPEIEDAENILVNSIRIEMTQVFNLQRVPNSNSLYITSDPLESIIPNAVLQGRIGNCYFAAALASTASNTNMRELIRNSIIENSDGTFTVTFPGAPDKPIKVTRPTRMEMVIFNRAGKHGIWPSVMEKAFGIYRGGYFGSNIEQENLDGGGFSIEVFPLLTGRKATIYGSLTASWTAEPVADHLEKLFSGENPQAVTASSLPRGPSEQDRTKKFFTEQNFVKEHSFSILRFARTGKDTGNILLRNPQGDESNSPLGTIEIPLDVFLRNFRFIEHTE